MIDQKEFENHLLLWYEQSKRVLPWRDNPTPYRVWISEIMLQQTRVEAVIPYFNRFISHLPDVYTLSLVEDDFLNKLWEGLGYYSRVRNLKKAAVQIVENFGGVIPNNQKDLESLPGIGNYTSGAILSIAFQQPFTAVDGNVLRVFARLTAYRENIKDPNFKKEIKQLVFSLLPKTRVGDFNQGLMEIGSTVCLPNGTPLCMVCPLQSFCESFANNIVSEIPVKQVKKKRRIEKKTVLIMSCDSLYAIEQRGNSGLLAGLYQFPLLEGHVTLKAIQEAYKDALDIKEIEPSKHIFTHLEWEIKAYSMLVKRKENNYIWVNKKEIENTYSIPNAFMKYKKMILGGE
ncbi:MAG: A/G-specific adenine glycosylase [Firmicutes bacterium]|nr:A/G-specific adenine glycosylase [Bacillota bacterium]